MQLSSSLVDQLVGAYQRDGFVVIPGVVSKDLLSAVSANLLSEFARQEADRTLIEGGGRFSGHLNCFPGVQSRAVYEALREAGILDLVRKVSPESVRAPNIGCNMNLSGSHEQNYHIDGYAASAFAVVNVAPVDTTLLNGAMEVTPGTHLRSFRYWEFVMARLPSRRVELNQGDVLVRSSALWHRGMPNNSARIRPMLAFTWEDGGSLLPDPYSQFEGNITFLPNRYTSDLRGRVREQAFARFPSLGNAYRFASSLLQR